MKKNIICILLTAFAFCMAGCGQNAPVPEEGSASREIPAEQKEVVRLDKDGYLYYMDYKKDYYSSEIIDALREGGFIDTGCSTFFTHNPDGESLTCRNYDYPHRVSDEDRTLTGLNIVLHCKPEGKYESIAMADAVWIDQKNPLLQKGGPDLDGFDVSMMDILPYQCVDGINEKGLSVALLKVDIKEGDQPAKYPIGSSMILRLLLDDCANVDEAIKKIDTAIVTPEDWQDCHIYVADADDNYAVIESRNGQVSVAKSDVVTNFYLTYDDMEDSYRNGKLREQAVMMTDENGEKEYNVGYGHGYHRFVTISSQLESHRDTASDEYRTVMPESAALVTLQSVVQNPDTTAVGISMTQYSVIYNHNKRTLEVWPFQNYEKSYVFDVTGCKVK